MHADTWTSHWTFKKRRVGCPCHKSAAHLRNERWRLWDPPFLTLCLTCLGALVPSAAATAVAVAAAITAAHTILVLEGWEEGGEARGVGGCGEGS